MITQEEQKAFDDAMGDPLWGIASPIPTILTFGTIALVILIIWLVK